MNRKILLAAVIVVATALSAWAQKSTYKGFPSLVWPKLYDIKFEKAKDDLGEYDKPVFSDAVKNLNGKEILLLKNQRLYFLQILFGKFYNLFVNA